MKNKNNNNRKIIFQNKKIVKYKAKIFCYFVKAKIIIQIQTILKNIKTKY